ncbi:MAG: hypothetical protein KC944_19340 [Candidatus Omnitrophica bacterium]|nr:hypothetical protein [Candidatus Omnitrophota bacterium]
MVKEQVNPTVIEQTSKKWKAMIFAGGVLTFTGLVPFAILAQWAMMRDEWESLATPAEIAAAMSRGQLYFITALVSVWFLGGIALFAVGKFGAWWHHG